MKRKRETNKLEIRKIPVPKGDAHIPPPGGMGIMPVHEFTMGDVEDPDLYAAEPMWKWQSSEMGQWVMEHAVETPFWHRHVDPYSYGYKYYIVAYVLENFTLGEPKI